MRLSKNEGSQWPTKKLRFEKVQICPIISKDVGQSPMSFGSRIPRNEVFSLLAFCVHGMSMSQQMYRIPSISQKTMKKDFVAAHAIRRPVVQRAISHTSNLAREGSRTMFFLLALLLDLGVSGVLLYFSFTGGTKHQTILDTDILE